MQSMMTGGTPAGQPDPQWNGNAQHVVRTVDDYHYSVQVSMPWKEIGVEPVEEQSVLGIDFGVNGKDSTPERMTILIAAA
jgi:hypothetical protein